MSNKILKIQQLGIILILICVFCTKGYAQLKIYQLSETGDTINGVDKNDLRQGKWVIRIAELRGEPGYEEEGIFKNGKKEGKWRRYNLHGDQIAIENYKFGGKEGSQQYFTMLGDLIRSESWHAYNPDAPFDTIPVYSNTDNNVILTYKIVKAEQYSVKDGVWKYFEAGTGRVIKSEVYERGALAKDPIASALPDGIAKKKIIPKEVLEFQKKNSGKKKVKLREGQTGY